MRDHTTYQGPREAAGIIEYTLDWLERHGAAPEVNQLLSPETYEEECAGPVICVLAALPHLLDTGKKGREDYLAVLMEVAQKNRKAPFRLFWSEAGAQSAAEEALGLTFGFPAVAALSKDKHVFATFKGAFHAASISSFLVGLTTGKESTAPLPPGALKVVKATAWDGREPPVVEEEEFSLEDIMAEEL
uniref:protein disulfide-isomerase n=1 Tax=Nannochloropsis gaditana (strain CCMP526) TaxID=1093141 RepID=I2CQT3_NANGC